MGFALWIDHETAWARGTHEYRPLGAAVIAVSSQFQLRDFDRYRKPPDRLHPSFHGLFGSIEEVNVFLRTRPNEGAKKRRRRIQVRAIL